MPIFQGMTRMIQTIWTCLEALNGDSMPQYAHEQCLCGIGSVICCVVRFWEDGKWGKGEKANGVCASLNEFMYFCS